MKGRKPLPAETKRRTGNPGGRPIGDPVLIGSRLVPTDGIPPVPVDLALIDELEDNAPGDAGSASLLWTQVVALLVEANMITEGDLFAVEQFVMATLEARRAWYELRTEGSTVETVNHQSGRAAKTTHPAYRVWRDANAMMLKWGEHLGLTPVARARLGLAVGKGRKLMQELDEGLPANPLDRGADAEGTAEDDGDEIIDIPLYDEDGE